MHKEYKYNAPQQSSYPSPFFDKEYAVGILTRAFHLLFGLSVGIGIGMVMCGVIKAIVIVIISALGYLATETDAWFYLPACIFRLIRNDYPNKDKLRKSGRYPWESDGLQKAIEWVERLPDDFLKNHPNASPASDSFDLHLRDDCLGEKSGPDMEETPNITEMEDEKDGEIQSEDDGGSEGVV